MKGFQIYQNYLCALKEIFDFGTTKRYIPTKLKIEYGKKEILKGKLVIV